MQGLGGFRDVEAAPGDLGQATQLLELHMLRIHKMLTQ
jgi:hypothetical protein